MKTLRALWCRIVGVFRPTASDTEFDAEMESHLELHIDEGVRAGLSPQEARRQAILALGGVERTREARRDRRGLGVAALAGLLPARAASRVDPVVALRQE